MFLRSGFGCSFMDGIMANLKPLFASTAIFLAMVALQGGPGHAQDGMPQGQPRPQAPDRAATPPPPAGSMAAQDPQARLDMLMRRLREPDLPNWKQVVEEIQAIWSKSGSDTLDLLLERGRAAIERQDYRAAIEHLTALIDHAPEFAEAWNSRAIAWFHLGKYGIAFSDISHALKLNPEHFGALSGLGLIYEETGHPEAARQVLEEARRLNPHDPRIKEALARIRRDLGGLTL